MLNLIVENKGSILVALVLTGMVCAIITKLIRDGRQGRSSCGGCAQCPMSGRCHRQ